MATTEVKVVKEEPSGVTSNGYTRDRNNSAGKPDSSEEKLDVVPYNTTEHAGRSESDDEADAMAHANAPFVNKVWRIVNDPANHQYIRWVQGGKSILIVDREGFEKQLLPLYYKHKNLTSFVRQLNMYGWHKVQDVNAGTMQSAEEHCQYANPNFIRGHPELLQYIVRNKGQRGNGSTNNNNNGNGPQIQLATNGAGAVGSDRFIGNSNSQASQHTGSTGNVPSSGSTFQSASGNPSQDSIQAVLRELEQIRSRQVTIGEDLSRMRKDNDMLWSEYSLMRERYDKHSQTLQHIFQFLARLYGKQAKGLSSIEPQIDRMIDQPSESDLHQMHYGLAPHSNNGGASISEFGDGALNHELREIEELQNRIDEQNAHDNRSNLVNPLASRLVNNSVPYSSPSPSSKERALVPSRAGSLAPLPTSRRSSQQIVSYPQSYSSKLVRASPSPFVSPLAHTYPSAQLQELDSDTPSSNSTATSNTPVAAHLGDLREATQGASDSPPGELDAVLGGNLDGNFFPSFGELEQPTLSREELERRLSRNESSFQAINDFLGMSGNDDIPYNVDDYLASDDASEKEKEKEKEAGEPNRKRSRSSL